MRTKLTAAEKKPVKKAPGWDKDLKKRGKRKANWSSLEDISGPETSWPMAINRVASSVCKDKTAEEVFHQINDELGRLGLSSALLIKESVDEDLLISNIASSSGGMTVFPGRVAGARKSWFTASDSEAISRVFSFGEVVLTSEPDENLRRLFPVLPGSRETAVDRRSFICAPLGYAGGIFGVLVACAPNLSHEKAHHVSLLAMIASLSYNNSCTLKNMDGLREKLECLDKGFGSAVSALDKSMQDMVHALTVPMERRDPYTFGHQMRVTRLAVAIAEEMGLAQYRVDGLKLAASIHDIGKIVIPFELLNRPTHLSEAEFMLVKMHPQVAFEMLSPISFRWPVAEIVRQHHERVNGSGYPRGLKSGETLLEAKVLAVADVVEAMSSHRPYRASLGIDAALEEVSSKAGTFYDTECVAACIRLLLINNFSMDDSVPAAWQNANPFTVVKLPPGD